jgi:hypothetical protein
LVFVADVTAGFAAPGAVGGRNARTYNFTYAYNEPGWRADYAALYIFNRMTSATVTPSGDRSVGTVGHDYADQRYYSGNTGRFWNPEILRLGDGEVLDGGPRRD